MSWQELNPGDDAIPVAPFSEQDIDYCHALSVALLAAPEIRHYPDLVALAFWLRRGNIVPLLEPYQQNGLCYKPLGRVFHNAPANVDSLFVYSGILSLLCGNANVIRLSNRYGGSGEVLLRIVQQLAEAFPGPNARFRLIRCAHQSAELQTLLAQVDGRVLWGSDQAILAQRALPVAAHTRDIIFNHKFSCCLLDAKAVLAADEDGLAALLHNFQRDNLTFNQQACSSAKAVIWLGNSDDVKAAQQRFWPALCLQVKQSSELNSSDYFQALTCGQRLAIDDPVSERLSVDTPLVRLQVRGLSQLQIVRHQGNGLFLELTITTLDALLPMLTPAHQTFSYWGVDAEALTRWSARQLCGVDRLVPVGQALDFSPYWDGMDLIQQFSRRTLLR